MTMVEPSLATVNEINENNKENVDKLENENELLCDKLDMRNKVTEENEDYNEKSNDATQYTVMHVNNTDQVSLEITGSKDDDLKNVTRKTEGINFIDSDSEDEPVFSSLLRKRKNRVEEDDNSCSKVTQGSDFLKIDKVSKSKNINRIIDSDSDDDNIINFTSKSITVDHKRENDLSSEEDSNSSDVEKKKLINKSNKSNNFGGLIDSESEDDRPMPNYSSEEDVTKNESKGSKKKERSKKRMGSIRASKDEAMRQIRSESQRLLRESEILLPYHRPKQRSLQDFLNRKKIISKLPKAPSAAAKVKMSLEIVSEALEEKEKEVESFYKSSDSEDETTSTNPLSVCSLTNIDSEEYKVPLSSNIENVGIEEAREEMKMDHQNECDMKEISRHDLKSLGVSRKLFTTDTNEIETREDSSQKQECDIEKDASKKKEVWEEIFKASENGLEDFDKSKNFIETDFTERIDTDSKDNDIALQENTEDRKSEDDNHVENIDTVIKSLETVIEENNDKNKSKMNMDDSVENDANDFVLRMSEESFDDFENLKISADKIALKENDQIENNDSFETPFEKNKDMISSNEKIKSVLETVVSESNSKDQGIAITKKIKTNTNNNVPESSSNITTDHLNDDKDTNNSTIPIGHVYGLPLPEFNDDKSSKKLKDTKSKILPNIINVNPKLRGSQGMIIDFSEDVKPNKAGVNNLWNRFLKHSVTSKNSENKSEISVIHTESTPDGLKAVKETLPYTLPVAEKNDPDLNKPGAKLFRLKEELKQKMTTKRNAEWEQKEQEMKDLKDDVHENDGSSYKFDDEEELEEEEEEELSDSGESEPEEDDMLIKDKQRGIKSAFIDNEAEVSDNEETGGSENDENEFDVEQELEENNLDSNEEGKDEENEEDKEDEDEQNKESEDDDDSNDEVVDKSRKLKRIVKAFEEDSNDAEVKSSENDETNVNSKRIFERTKTDVDIFSEGNSNDAWASDTEVELPVFQAQNQQTDVRSPTCKTPLASTNYLNFVSPITQLTALNTCSDSVRKDSASKSAYSLQVAESLSVETTPIDKKSQGTSIFGRRMGLQKKLFDDPSEMVNDDELMDLCSGKFTGTENDSRKFTDLIGSSAKMESSESQLLSLCSGTFTTQRVDLKNLEVDSTQTENENGQNVNPTLDKDQAMSMKNSACEEHKIKSNTPWTAFTTDFSSDEESDSKCKNDETDKTRKLKRKKVKKLELSDDEEECLSEVENDAEGSENEEEFIDYDSEENEIVKIPKRNIKKVAATFLEEEAELSESDWSSADEDEKDLDKLEWEEGDDDEFDEDQMRKQIEKIQMRQMLDEDQRKVSMIKEMLFEDGDLYSDGVGRQRKFKWRNIDKLGENDKDNPRVGDEEDVSVDQYEEENELEWRKLRIEREKFVEEKKKEKVTMNEIEDELNDSQIFKMGLEALKKIKNNQSHSQEISSTASKSIIPRTMSDILNNSMAGRKSCVLQNAIQRGSFLARGEESLARIAVMVKQNKETVNFGPKNTRNFVFAHLSPSTKPDEEDKEEQQNKDVSRNKNFKRKSTSDMTPRAIKKIKTEGNRSKGKKLF